MVFAFNIEIPTPDRSFIAPKTVYGNVIDAIRKEIQGYKLGLAMRRFLLMRIDAHQMRIDAHEPNH